MTKGEYEFTNKDEWEVEKIAFQKYTLEVEAYINENFPIVTRFKHWRAFNDIWENIRQGLEGEESRIEHPEMYDD